MTLLAHVISYLRGVSPITDNRTLDRFGIFTRRPHSLEPATINAAQAVIQLELPANLNDIPLETIIDHRNQPGFKERLRAFHKELDIFLSNAEHPPKPGYFGSTLGNAWDDFRDEIFRLAPEVAVFGLSVWILTGSGSFESLNVAKEVLGGLGLTIGASLALKKTWEHTKTKRWTRKYLADLGEIKHEA